MTSSFLQDGAASRLTQMDVPRQVPRIAFAFASCAGADDEIARNRSRRTDGVFILRLDVLYGWRVVGFGPARPFPFPRADETAPDGLAAPAAVDAPTLDKPRLRKAS